MLKDEEDYHSHQDPNNINEWIVVDNSDHITQMNQMDMNNHNINKHQGVLSSIQHITSTFIDVLLIEAQKYK